MSWLYLRMAVMFFNYKALSEEFSHLDLLLLISIIYSQNVLPTLASSRGEMRAQKSLDILVTKKVSIEEY